MFSKNKTKKKNPILSLLIIFLLVYLFTPNNLNKDIELTIDKGLSTIEIADLLKENEVIDSKIKFLITVAVSEYRGDLKYGTFTFEKGNSYSDIIKKLATQGAKKETVMLTIPEGYSTEQIIDKLHSLGFGKKADIIEALNKDYDYEFLKNIDFPSKCSYKLQGFLFPSTYEFYKDATPYEIFNTMLGEFEKQYNSLNISYDNIYKVITTASLIEREAKIDSERKIISGVIKNRLNLGMLLQIDASVVYAISDGLYNVERVLYKDLEIDSPYNTYKYKGLPIGPIANPGLSSIKAAVNPDVHDYLYYRTDTSKNDGSHIFTKDFESHKDAN